MSDLGCPACGDPDVHPAGALCQRCGGHGVRVLDRRGEQKPSRPPAAQVYGPGDITEVYETGKGGEFLFVMPGNRIAQHTAILSPYEAKGLRLILDAEDDETKREAIRRNRFQLKAAKAAQRKMLQVVQKAVRMHEEASKASAVPEAWGVQ